MIERDVDRHIIVMINQSNPNPPEEVPMDFHFHNPAPSSRNSSTFPSSSIRSISSVSFRQHINHNKKDVPISIAARVARPPAQCARRKALPHHRATTQDLEELEELGRAMDARWRFDLLLQHFQRVC